MRSSSSVTASSNHLVLAAAGSGKTHDIIRVCAEAPESQRILILTYTTANQGELVRRLAASRVKASVTVEGWFSFLLEHFVRPYAPFKFPGKRVRGFDFQSPRRKGESGAAYSTYFNKNDQVKKAYLAKLATLINSAANNIPITRLAKSFDVIHIDEVQDLNGYDLDIVELLLKSTLEIHMVGDVRQAIIATNVHDPRYSQYRFLKIWNWFQMMSKRGMLRITQKSTTYRCHPEIARFADGIFSLEHGFSGTISLNTKETAHDGVYLIREKDITDYQRLFSPMMLRDSIRSGKHLSEINFRNFGEAKGLEADHVVIYPTAKMAKLLSMGTPLDSSAATRLYVAVTRARQSVAFVLDKPGNSTLPYWTPLSIADGVV